MTDDIGPSAVDRAQDEIRRLILDGTYRGGTKLKEEKLAEAVGASRTPIREALLRLQGEGLVEFATRRGAFVADWSIQDLQSIFDLRVLLEGYGARLAALNAAEADIAALDELATKMEQAWAEGGPTAVDDISRYNNEFHGRVMSASGNTRLESLQKGLIQVPLVLRTFRRYKPSESERSLHHHRELVDAIIARDPEWAASVMHAHILAARRVFIHDHDGGGPGSLPTAPD